MPQTILISAGKALTIGGRSFDSTEMSNLIVLSGAVTSTNGSTLRKGNGTSGYQVPGGKTFRVVAIETFNMNSSTADNSPGRLLYSDNDNGMNSTAAASFSNPVYLGGDSGVGGGTGVGTAYGIEQEVVQFDIPTGKYPGLKSNGGNTRIRLYGYEV